MAVWLANCDRLPVTTSSRLSTALEVPNQVCSGGFGRECPSVAERPLAIMAQGKGRGEGTLVIGGQVCLSFGVRGASRTDREQRAIDEALRVVEKSSCTLTECGSEMLLTFPLRRSRMWEFTIS